MLLRTRAYIKLLCLITTSNLCCSQLHSGGVAFAVLPPEVLPAPFRPREVAVKCGGCCSCVGVCQHTAVNWWTDTRRGGLVPVLDVCSAFWFGEILQCWCLLL